jgi:hypothetical protein
MMSILGRVEELSRPRLGKQILVCLLLSALLFAAGPQALPAYQDQQVAGRLRAAIHATDS